MFPQPAFEFISFDSRAGFLWIHHWLPLGALVFLGSWCLRLLSARKPTRSQSHPGHRRPWRDFWDKQSTVFWLNQNTTSENLMSQEKLVWDMRNPYRSNILTHACALSRVPYGDAMMRSFWGQLFQDSSPTFDANELTTWQQDNAE